MAKLLVVDDEQSICWAIKQLAQNLGHEVQAVASAEEGLEFVAANVPDLLILDVRLPGMDGLTAMQRFRSHIGSCPIIVITAFGALETAVDAVQQGAFEYVVKPFDLATIRSIIQRALEFNRCQQSSHEGESPEALEGILGKSRAMQEVFKQIALASAADVAVLLHGESGVGKELAAHAIHRHSKRSKGPFVGVNVAALSPALAEAELFGHVAGAFTGASQTRKGLLVQADQGTLFLDEVAEIPLPLQVKLLRVLDQGEVLPLGADEPVKTNFRIIAASHQNLPGMIRSGEFRHDLFYRLSAFEITVPPLRDRREDIPLLAQHFAARQSGQTARLADETLQELRRRTWQGNVRELRNAVEHALVVAREGVILPEHLPPTSLTLAMDSGGSSPLAEVIQHRAESLLSDPVATGSVYEKFLQEIEPVLFSSALIRYDNECAPAARALGLHRTTLKKKLDQYGLH